jgi:hypothetical protein
MMRTSAPGGSGAEAFVGFVLDEPQQLGLKRGRQVADFIQKQGAALAGGDAARIVPDRAGERALDVPEEFAFQQVGGNRGAGYGRHGFGRPRTPVVDGLGQRRLAGAAFPLEQEDCLGSGGFAGGVDDPLHGGVGALEPHRRGSPFPVRLQRGDLGFQPPDPADAPGQQPDLIRREGFGDVVLGPPPHGFHRAFDRGVGRDDHDFHPGKIRQQAGDQVHAVFRPQPQIDKGQIEGPPFGLR